MTPCYSLIKWLHILSSTVLFGTGAGIAFFFVRAHGRNDPKEVAAIAGDVVLADMLFTATAVVLQPITGIALARIVGYPFSTAWLALSIVLYVFVGCCWLPVVWLQVKMRDIARASAATDKMLPPLYHRYYRCWFVLGWPAFIGVMAIFYLMTAKPQLPKFLGG